MIGLNTEELKNEILSFLLKNALSFEELLLRFPDKALLRQALNSLTADFSVVIDKSGRFCLPETMGLKSGVLQQKRQGYAFLLHKDGDVLIDKRNLNGALNRQTVLVKIISGSHGRLEGKVIKIKDEPYTVVGTVKKSNGGAILVPDDRAVPVIKLPRKGRNAAKAGDKALCVLTRVPKRGALLEGKVLEILGASDKPGVDVLSTERSFGLYEKFPKDVLNIAASFKNEVSEDELKGRKLLFDKKIFTIDGDDSKDLDDAVSLEKSANSSYYLGVHIADVSHYVKEAGALDKEALKRATSVYFPDRVIPMLPRELSNGICSLNENSVRLTLSCFMKIDSKGNVLSHKIMKTAIRSSHRMTYANVNKLLSGDPELLKEFSDISKDLSIMNELAHILREKRFMEGSLDFDIPEPKITLGEDGIPTDVFLRPRGDAEKMIEEFMLAANNTVAKEYELKALPFVYRIHEKPDPEKMGELADFLSSFGYDAPKNGYIPPHILNGILRKSENTADEAIIHRVMLRSLKKARYSTANEGHFGLASECYCHFTSPIRRYPDLQIHRIIKEDLECNLTEKRISHYKRILPGVCLTSSERERNAVSAERQVTELKEAQYMEKFIGEEFDAVISGLTSGCLFAELKNTIEGVIPLSSIKDDYYELIQKSYMVKGRKKGNIIRLGDSVKVCVAAVNPDESRIEFSLLKRNSSRRKKAVSKDK